MTKPKTPPAAAPASPTPPTPPPQPPAQATPEPEAPVFAVVDEGVVTLTDHWSRSDDRTHAALEALDVQIAPEVVTAWSDDEIRAIDVWAITETLALDNATVPTIERPPVLVAALEPADLTAAMQQELAGLEAEPPIAVRIEDGVIQGQAALLALLGDLIASRYGVYFHPPHGYSHDAKGPYYDRALVNQAVVDGFCFVEPSGGGHGSVKISDAGVAEYKRLRQTATVEA